MSDTLALLCDLEERLINDPSADEAQLVTVQRQILTAWDEEHRS